MHTGYTLGRVRAPSTTGRRVLDQQSRERDWCAWCGEPLRSTRIESRVGLVCQARCLAGVLEDES